MELVHGCQRGAASANFSGLDFSEDSLCQVLGNLSQPAFDPDFDRLALAQGAGVGLVVGLGAVGLYGVFLRDTPLMAQTGARLLGWLREYHVATPAGYWTMAILMTTLHAFLEEYYWRWFVFRRLHRHLPLGWATALSSLGFMLHHIVILSIYLPGYFWEGVLPFSLCVAVGGVIWALLYNHARSLYPVWLSHGLVDFALMCVGWDLVNRSW